jgi:DNA-binding Xre family transcriptional regulator
MKTKMMKVVLLLVVFLSFLLSAQDKMKVYVIESAPLGFIENGQSKGIHFEMVEAISKESGIPMEVKVVPKGRIFKEIKDGTIDGSVFFPGQQWEEFTANGGSVSNVQLVAISKKNLPINSYDDLYKTKSI